MLNNLYCSALKFFFFKKFSIASGIVVKIFYFKTKQVITLKYLQNTYFFVCPTFLNLAYKNNNLYLSFKSNNLSISYKNLFFFLIHLCQSLKQLCKLSSLTFLIKGVGLKINLVNNVILNLKLGYSHIISLLLPLGVGAFTFKKKIILCSYNKISLGNIGNVLYRYRPINIFTGKGLLKKQKIRFKLKGYTKKI